MTEKEDESNKYFHRNLWFSNPTFGYVIFGPILPAQDNTIAQTIVGGLQLSLGVNMFTGKAMNNPRLRYGRWLYRFAGAGLIFLTLAEIQRQMWYKWDPWILEAKRERIEAQKRGEKTSWWFGPKNYRTMSFDRYVNSLTNAYSRVINVTDLVNQSLNDNSLEREMITKDYVNRQILNKAIRIDVLKQLPSEVDGQKDKDPHKLDELRQISEQLDFDDIWEELDPWEELWNNINYTYRLIPPFKVYSQEEDEEEDEISSGHETELVLKQQKSDPNKKNSGNVVRIEFEDINDEEDKNK